MSIVLLQQILSNVTTWGRLQGVILMYTMALPAFERSASQLKDTQARYGGRNPLGILSRHERRPKD